MNALTELPAFSAYAGALIVLGLNLIGLANATAITRAGADEVVNPEDQALNKKASVVLEAGNEKTARYKRAHRNALENTPLFMITAFVLTLMGTSATVGAILFGAYAFFRILHSICYVKGIQPLRTAAFGIGAVIQIVVLGFIGYGAFAG